MLHLPLMFFSCAFVFLLVYFRACHLQKKGGNHSFHNTTSTVFILPLRGEWIPAKISPGAQIGVLYCLFFPPSYIIAMIFTLVKCEKFTIPAIVTAISMWPPGLFSGHGRVQHLHHSDILMTACYAKSICTFIAALWHCLIKSDIWNIWADFRKHKCCRKRAT